MLVRTIVDAVKAKTDLTKLFRRNACMRHGIPWNENDESVEEKLSVNVNIPPVTVQPPTTVDTQPTNLQPVSAVLEEIKKKKSFVQRWGPVVALLLAGGGGGAGLGILGTHFLNQPEETQTVVVPDEEQNQASLLQYLEDQGEHLP